MDKFCEDCVHNAVCQYGAYCPSGHCNDKDTLDDLIPQGKWIYLGKDEPMKVECPFCHERKCCVSNYCDYCGAKMQNGGAE